jgi:hypothetical protein
MDADNGAEAVTYRVSTYYKRPKGQPGVTSLSSGRLSAGEALTWIVNDLPDDALTVTREQPEGADDDIVTLVIDWNKVPASIASPKIPTRNGRRL